MNASAPRRVHVLGQGVAGSCLAWCLYRAGLPFVLWDPGHAQAASRVGAGIMNPITGQRLVPSWRWTELLPQALALYRDIEYETGARILRPFRIRRLFADDREQRIFARKQSAGELGPGLGATFAGGFWIEGAWQADSSVVIAAVRTFFKARGFLREEAPPLEVVGGETTLVCTGHAAVSRWPRLPLQPWEGAILSFPAAGLDPSVIVNRGAWVLPWSAEEARCGSTYWPPGTSLEEQARGQSDLAAEASTLVDRPISVSAVLKGWRVATADRRPIAGWIPREPQLGVLLGLGAKGSLLAPFLAGQWVAHLRSGQPFHPEIDLSRFWKE